MYWYAYILRCENKSYYVGHITDIKAQMALHNAGKGSAHTAKYRPVQLVYSEPYPDQASAMARERQLKKWSRAKKEALISNDLAQLKDLAKCRIKKKTD